MNLSNLNLPLDNEGKGIKNIYYIVGYTVKLWWFPPDNLKNKANFLGRGVRKRKQLIQKMRCLSYVYLTCVDWLYYDRFLQFFEQVLKFHALYIFVKV